MLIQALGADHVLWGTDSIWWGSPRWQIEALRRFQMPEVLMQRLGYAPLTGDVKGAHLRSERGEPLRRGPGRGPQSHAGGLRLTHEGRLPRGGATPEPHAVRLGPRPLASTPPRCASPRP